MSKFEEVRDLVASLEADFEAFYEKGNKAAGVRVRKGMQDLKAMAQDIRVDVQTRKNA
ncbi:MAG: histone H1 [Pseudomonadota bacterium]